ncbi:MAG TPA: hypothetical protein VNY83_02885 [Solirubrobacterales bacterium]|jgi:hypothetical protein|nr:hypothetical protein [Solirubrobacterales bacterium]
MPDEINVLLIDETAAEKLGARDISDGEARQLLRNANAIGPNPRGGEERRLLVGLTDGGRALTLVVERTLEPSSWLVVTGWNSTKSQRKILES